MKALTAEAGLSKVHPSAAEVVGALEVYVPLTGIFDLEQERKRLEARIEKAGEFLASIERKLSNASFVEKAPKPVVDRERERQRAAREELDKLTANLDDLAT